MSRCIIDNRRRIQEVCSNSLISCPVLANLVPSSAARHLSYAALLRSLLKKPSYGLMSILLRGCYELGVIA
jgi:hypothetical protein